MDFGQLAVEPVDGPPSVLGEPVARSLPGPQQSVEMEAQAAGLVGIEHRGQQLLFGNGQAAGAAPADEAQRSDRTVRTRRKKGRQRGGVARPLGIQHPLQHFTEHARAARGAFDVAPKPEQIVRQTAG